MPETPRRATINDDIAPDEMTPAKARELLDAAADDGRVLGRDPVDRPRDHRQGRSLRALRHRGAARDRRRGAQARQGARRPSRAPRSLFKDMDLATIDLDDGAAAAVAAPGRRDRRRRTAIEITAQNGRYGPYLKKGTDSRSLETEQQLFDITLEEALAIYAQPKQRGRAAAASAQGARHRPGVGQGGVGQGRPVRGLRHRRRDQRHAATRRRPRVDHARARARAARREAGQGSDDPQAGGEEDHQVDGQEDDRQEDGRGPRYVTARASARKA